MDDLPPEVRAAMESAPLPNQRDHTGDVARDAPRKPIRPGAENRQAPSIKPAEPQPKRSIFSRFTRHKEQTSGGQIEPQTTDQKSAEPKPPKSTSAVKKAVRRPTSPIEALEPKPAPAPEGGKLFRMARPSKQPSPLKHKEPQKMRRSGGFVAFAYTISTIAFILALTGTVIYYGKVAFEGDGPLNEPLVVVIQKGIGLSGIADELERQGVIDDANIFKVGVRVNGKQAGLKAGEYAIPSGASMARVMNILFEGKAIQLKVTVPEGRTSIQVVEILNAKEDLNGPIDEIPAEGTLLPETYTYPRNTPRAEIIKQMMRAQAKILEDLWSSRAPGLPFKTPEEAVILASIVEKETGQSSERRQVASVFINRLKRNMRLQSDPTIIYGITEGKGPLGRPILQSDIDRQTPFNTYQINGLPPTPIANPGRAALEATLDPAATNFIFFVADGTGGHVFAATLAEHTANVARWRQIERRIRREQEEQAAAKAAASASAKSGSGAIETQTQDLVLPGQ